MTMYTQQNKRPFYEMALEPMGDWKTGADHPRNITIIRHKSSVDCIPYNVYMNRTINRKRCINVITTTNKSQAKFQRGKLKAW